MVCSVAVSGYERSTSTRADHARQGRPPHRRHPISPIESSGETSSCDECDRRPHGLGLTSRWVVPDTAVVVPNHPSAGPFCPVDVAKCWPRRPAVPIASCPMSRGKGRGQPGSQPRQRAGAVPASPAATSAPTSAAPGIDRRHERVGLIRTLREARGVDLTIAYVTSSRPGIAAQMSLDAVRRVADHLPDNPVGSLDLFLSSDGGDSIVPWRLMTLLRDYATTVDVLIPHRAFSAATLAALGADKIVMHPMGILGPIDPTVHDPFGPIDPESGQRPGVSVEDVSAYNELVEDVGINDEAGKLEAFSLLAREVHPLTLGHVKRGSAQARMLGEKLLRLRDPAVDGSDVDRLIDELTTKLYYHGHPINRTEARELGLHVDDDPSREVAAAMWELYKAYETDMEMERPFDPIAEAADRIPVPPPGGSPKAASVGTLRRVVVESEARADAFELDLEITLGRNSEGALTASTVSTNIGWVEG
jgi:Serine dehydrogenase proteinase